jgi:hypothetical protein
MGIFVAGGNVRSIQLFAIRLLNPKLREATQASQR